VFCGRSFRPCTATKRAPPCQCHEKMRHRICACWIATIFILLLANQERHGHDREWAGKRMLIRILSVADAFTWECLAPKAGSSLGSDRVTWEPNRLVGKRSQPESVRSDNGPESHRGACWAGKRSARSSDREKDCEHGSR